MNALTKQQSKQIIGGSISGAVFSGIGDIIESSMEGINSLIGSINSTILVSKHGNTVKGSYKTSDGATFQWDDTSLIGGDSSLIH